MPLESVGPERGAGSREGTPPWDPPRRVVVLAARSYDSPSLVDALSRSGFAVTEAASFAALAGFPDDRQPQTVVVIADLATPGCLEALTGLSSATSATLVFVAPDSAQLVPALRAGADACLSDPDGPAAIVAQVEALRRRLQRGPGGQPAAAGAEGPIRVDLASHDIETPLGRARLTETEMAILAYLGRRPGEVVPALELLQAAVGKSGTEEDARRAVKVYVQRLRTKLLSVGLSPKTISNVRGRGYLLDVRTRLS